MAGQARDVTVVIATEGGAAGSEVKKDIHLADVSKNLGEARASLSADLDLGARNWHYVNPAVGSTLSDSSEKTTTLAALIAKDAGAPPMLHVLAAPKPPQQDVGERAKRAAEAVARSDTQVAALEAALRQAAGSQLVTLTKEQVQEVMATLKFSETAIEVGGDTGKSVTEMSDDEVELVLRRLGLPLVAQFADDGSLKASSCLSDPSGVSVSLSGAGNVYKRIAQSIRAVNEIECSASLVQHSFQARSISSGFDSTMVSAAAGADFGTWGFSTSVKYTQASKTAIDTAASEQFVQGVAKHLVRKAEITVPIDALEMSSGLLDQIRQAVTSNNREALAKLFDKYSWFVITKCNVGGMLYSEQAIKRTADLTQSKEEFERVFASTVGASYGSITGSAGVGHTSGGSTDVTTGTSDMEKNMQLSAKGGSATDFNKPSIWTASLRPTNWAIVENTVLLPMYELIRDQALRNSVTTLLGAGRVAAPLVIKVFSATSGNGQHTSVDVTVPKGFRVISGGAVGSEGGHLITASIPLLDGDVPYGWHAEGKDHIDACSATVTAYALAIQDTNSKWTTHCWKATSGCENHPGVNVAVEQGWTMTGGGAKVNWGGQGSLLTCSCAADINTWRGAAKDHIRADPSTVTAYVIGMKHASGNRLETALLEAASPAAQHPSCEVRCPGDKVILGGGGYSTWSNQGQLLWELRPTSGSFVVSSKDHKVADNGRTTARIIVCNALF